jgi:hypothetical protein
VTRLVVLDPRELGFSRVRICPAPLALRLHTRRIEPRPAAIRGAFVLRQRSSRRYPCRCEPAPSRHYRKMSEGSALTRIWALSRDRSNVRASLAAGRAIQGQ